MHFKETIVADIEVEGVSLVLAADVGGTNSNFGVFYKYNDKMRLLRVYHIDSKDIQDFTAIMVTLLNQIYKHFSVPIEQACIAAAGVISESRDFCRLTNRPIEIDAKAIMQATGLPCVILANDFEAIGYGIDQVASRDLVLIRPGKVEPHANRAIVGAGTGLGKSILHWNCYKERYEPVASEGGHADCSVQRQIELDLINFIREREKRSCNISWEDVLSGYGIERIYQFFKERNNHLQSHESLMKNGPHPDEIFNSRMLDEHARATYELYATLYARCVKNFALDSLSLNGMYITGGIAVHNVQMFKEDIFIREFLNCGKQQALLERIPLIIIADYYVNLYGAAEFLRIEKLCDLLCD